VTNADELREHITMHKVKLGALLIFTMVCVVIDQLISRSREITRDSSETAVVATLIESNESVLRKGRRPTRRRLTYYFEPYHFL